MSKIVNTVLSESEAFYTLHIPDKEYKIILNKNIIDNKSVFTSKNLEFGVGGKDEDYYNTQLIFYNDKCTFDGFPGWTCTYMKEYNYIVSGRHIFLDVKIFKSGLKSSQYYMLCIYLDELKVYYSNS